jgi:hypothetical protein
MLAFTTADHSINQAYQRAQQKHGDVDPIVLIHDAYNQFFSVPSKARAAKTRRTVLHERPISVDSLVECLVAYFRIMMAPGDPSDFLRRADRPWHDRPELFFRRLCHAANASDQTPKVIRNMANPP